MHISIDMSKIILDNDACMHCFVHLIPSFILISFLYNMN